MRKPKRTVRKAGQPRLDRRPAKVVVPKRAVRPAVRRRE